MDKILLAICNGLSCFIICTILFQFMNEIRKVTAIKLCT